MSVPTDIFGFGKKAGYWQLLTKVRNNPSALNGLVNAFHTERRKKLGTVDTGRDLSSVERWKQQGIDQNSIFLLKYDIAFVVHVCL